MLSDNFRPYWLIFVYLKVRLLLAIVVQGDTTNGQLLPLWHQH